MRGAAQSHLPPGHLHQALVLHFFQLPHHGTAVGGDIVRQGAEGEGQLEALPLPLARQQAEIAQQLFPDAAAAEVNAATPAAATARPPR